MGLLAISSMLPAAAHVCCVQPKQAVQAAPPRCPKCPEEVRKPVTCKECEHSCKCALSKPTVEAAVPPAVTPPNPEPIADLPPLSFVEDIRPEIAREIIPFGLSPPPLSPVRATCSRAPPVS